MVESVKNFYLNDKQKIVGIYLIIYILKTSTVNIINTIIRQKQNFEYINYLA
jgi:hypothetical protein